MEEPGNQKISEISDSLPGKLDLSRLTPYDLIRLQNCKFNKFQKKESYPSIRPPVSKCSSIKTGTLLLASAAEAGCDRKKKCDLIEMWKQSPNKDSLSCYGLGGTKPKSDAILFNRAMINSLNKVNGVDARSTNKIKLRQAKKRKLKKSEPNGHYVLNRNVLQSVIKLMPTVMRKASHKAANTIRYCPKPVHAAKPFHKDEPYFPLQVAIDIAKPAPQPKRVVPRKYRHCAANCCIPENACTQYEWLKYRENPGPQDKAFKEKLATRAFFKISEPKNFDSLYSQLVSCFEKTPHELAECSMYSKCCRRRSERQHLQGCGENDLPDDCTCGEVKSCEPFDM